jgi:ubiquinone/menaquinone biosynthesis C-methylase UbiE
MLASDRHQARSFDRVAGAYRRARPSYPAAAVEWALEAAPGRRVVDLAAGTGKLTEVLVAAGADVVAVEPLANMRAELERALPSVRALDGSAERIPLPGGSADAVLVGQAFHWFDGPAALAEIARVLVPGGALGLSGTCATTASPGSLSSRVSCSARATC